MKCKLAAAAVFLAIFSIALLYGEPAPDQVERNLAWWKIHQSGR